MFRGAFKYALILCENTIKGQKDFNVRNRRKKNVNMVTLSTQWLSSDPVHGLVKLTTYKCDCLTAECSTIYASLGSDLHLNASEIGLLIKNKS